MPDFPTSDFPAVFAHFGAVPVVDHSCYRWAPVFPVDFEGRRAVVKHAAPLSGEAVSDWCRALAEQGVRVVTPLAGPAMVGDRRWVVYPWIEGRGYRGVEDLAAAGDLLGRVHACRVRVSGMMSLSHPDLTLEDPANDLRALRELFTRNDLPDVPGLVAGLEPLARGFEHGTLPAIHFGGLPVVRGSYDFRAVNLVYAEDGPVLVDPDGGIVLPRIVDLAFAALLFHHEMEGAPGRTFDAGEWRVFRDAYLSHVDLTEAERGTWPDALDYVLWEEGTWAAEDSSEWDVPRQRAFLVDLLGTSRDAFPLE